MSFREDLTRAHAGTIGSLLAGDGIPPAMRGALEQQQRELVAEAAEVALRERVLARLAELEAMEDGWLDGHGMAPTEAALGAARSILLDLAKPELPPAHIYPHDTGDVEAEWDLPDGGDATLLAGADGTIEVMLTDDEEPSRVDAGEATARLLAHLSAP